MAERSFKEEVKQLRLGAGEEFRGEGILAVTKALLQSGVVLCRRLPGRADLAPDGRARRRATTSSRSSASTSRTAPARRPRPRRSRRRSTIRCAARSPSSRPVGTNVASDALANLASGGVTGGALIIVGEDYGEGSSIMQERSHAFAMKSQIWLLDPRPNLPSIVEAVEEGFELSEACNTPVMLELRIRACHVHGRFTAKDNVRAGFTLQRRAGEPARATPTASCCRRRAICTRRRRSRSAGRRR